MTKKCPECNCEFEAKKAQSKFCSRECKYKARRGKILPQSTRDKMATSHRNKHPLKISIKEFERLYWEEGLSVAKIAKQIGMSTPSLYGRMKKEGASFRPNKESMGRGEKSHNWNGGESIDGSGYIRYTCGERRGRPVHRVVAEKMEGRKLERGEVVHHINGIRTDNREDR